MGTATGPATAKHAIHCPGLRIAYRAGDGNFHCDWPPERLAEAMADREGTLWVDIQNDDGDEATVETILRDVFQFHPLAVEDALKENHLPKIDDWGHYLYTVFHVMTFDPKTDDLALHELDAFLARNYLVTYHTEPMAILDRLWAAFQRDDRGGLQRGPDFLLYQIFDLGASEYMGAVEHLDESIDDAQEEVFDRPSPDTLRKIFGVKRSVMRLHRVLGPQREVFNRLARDLYPQIDDKDRVYFRDVYDHMVRLHDVSESLRDLVAGALDTYLSAVSNRTNDSMKTLTIVTMLFLPLNFLVGFFGMNFFGSSIELTWPEVPHALLFGTAFLAMIVGPWAMWVLGKRYKWF